MRLESCSFDALYLIVDVEDGLSQVLYALLLLCLVTVGLALSHKVFQRVADGEVEVTADFYWLYAT